MCAVQMGIEFVSCLQRAYLRGQVLRQLLWRCWCIKQTCEQLHAQAHLHATHHRKNTVITQTPLMWLLMHTTRQWPYHHPALTLFIQVHLEENDCNARHDL